MLISFKDRNGWPMVDGELTFARRLSVFTGDNSLGTSFLWDLVCLRRGASDGVPLDNGRA